MGFWQDLGKNLGFGHTDADTQSEENLAAAKAAYEKLKLPTLTQEHPDYAQATNQGASQLGSVSVDPAYKQTQQDQIGALRDLAANGGHNAASDANLARIQQQEQANARGQREAVLQNANARGVGGSGASLLAQLDSNQAQQNAQNMQDMQVRGQDQSNALQAGMGAAQLAGQMGNTDYAQQANKAQANDAIARFNAGQATGVSGMNAQIGNQAQQYNTGLQQQGYQNQFQKQAGIAGADMNAVADAQHKNDVNARKAGNIFSGITQIGAAAAMPAPAAAWGGKIPGHAPVAGDSKLNDLVPAKLSPGEVVVPRSLAQQGSHDAISHFVKNPPSAVAPDKNKEAMLAALKNMRRRG